MSLLPVLLNEMLEDYRRPFSMDDLYDQHFGLPLDHCPAISPQLAINIPGLRAGYLRPWRLSDAADSGVSSVKNDEKEFSVRLDVTHFKPEELSVKVDDKGYVVVEGKHEEKGDAHGFISRQFTRRYKLPEDTKVESLKSNLSSDGVLMLKADKKPIEASQGREIKITQTNQPALKGKKNSEHKEGA